MKRKWLLVVLSLIGSLAVGLPVKWSNNQPMTIQPEKAEAFTQRTLIRGSAGADVYELQGRLRKLGFYHGRIDGVFGWQTYWGLRNFQSRFGLKVDGRFAQQTRSKLLAATPGFHLTQAKAHTDTRPNVLSKNRGGNAPVKIQSVPDHSPISSSLHGNLTPNDVNLLVHLVNGEARGEPFEGQVAVAAVIMNRLKSPLFPHSISGIIFQPGAFTATSDGQMWVGVQDNSPKRAVITALKGFDPSDGAIYYFNPATATSRWIWSRPQIKQIGKHIFCR